MKSYVTRTKNQPISTAKPTQNSTVRPVIPHPTFKKPKPHSESTFHRAYSQNVPSAIAIKANEIWMQQAELTDTQFFGDCYLEPTPSNWITQQLGIGMSIVRELAEHIKCSKFKSDANKQLAITSVVGIHVRHLLPLPRTLTSACSTTRN